MGLLTPRTPRVKGWSARMAGVPSRSLNLAGSAVARSPSAPSGPERAPTSPARAPSREANGYSNPAVLPSSVVGGHSAPKTDLMMAAYQWRPVQLREHTQSSEMSWSVGTYVNTLSMCVGSKTFEGATSHLIRLESGGWTARESLWCYSVGGNFVLCKGLVTGTCPREHDPAAGRDVRITRLPVHMRPRSPLQFAAICRETYGLGGHTAFCSHLVTLLVTPDGWISGISAREVAGTIDLSAIRFCVSGGISLVDEVSLHTIDIGGTRMVCLQGTLTERFYVVHNQRPLVLFPESCRPPRELPFIVAGTSPGGFHLLMARPTHGCGVGGDLMWRDSIWNHDRINLTGLMFEVAEDALQVSTLSSSWTGESLRIFVNDFQNFLIRKFGSIGAAWEIAFDTDESGSINFTEFGLGCKASGYVGNATRLWAALDEDRSGEISLEELNTGQQPDTAMLEDLGMDSRTLCPVCDSPVSRKPAKKMSLYDLMKTMPDEREDGTSSSAASEMALQLPGMAPAS